MSGPVATYSYSTEEAEDEMTPPEDASMEVGLARQTEKLNALEKTMGREFTHIGNTLDKIGAFILELKSEFVTKAAHDATTERLSERVGRIEKIVYPALGVILLAFLGAVLINIGWKS